MRRILPLLLLSSSFALATEYKPFVTATTGLTMPYVEFDDPENPLAPTLGYSFTLGAGARVPVLEKLRIEASGGLTFLSGGLDGDQTRSSTRSGVTERRSYTLEANVYPRLVDLDAGASYLFLPNLSVGGGLTFSIPVGGTWKVKESYEVTCTPPGGAYCYEEEDRDSESGDIEEMEDDAEVEVGSFASLRIGGEYAVNDRIGVTTGFLFPLGSWLKESDVDVSWSRLLIGGRYNF